MIDELIENTGFWLLAGGGLIAEVLGYILSKRMGFEAFPLWQLIIVMIGTVVAAAFFATRS